MLVQLNLHRLWIFLQVVDSGGFSAAAQKLYMSQPSVSNQVRQLESSLGAVLVDRSGSRIRPTAEGSVLAEHARQIFELADSAVAAIQSVQGLSSGRLSVGGTTTVGTYLLPRLLARFRSAHPRIDCDLFVGNEAQARSRLLDGELGLAVFAGSPVADQLAVEEILTDRLLLVCAPSHPLAGSSVLPSALASERFLLRERGSSTRTLQLETLASWDLAEVPTADMWGPETLKQAIRATLGIALISEHAVGDELSEGWLVPITVTPAPASRPVTAAHRHDRSLSPAEQAFLTLLRGLRSWPEL